MRKSIRTKVFRTVLGVSLMFGVLIGAAAVSQFWRQKQATESINRSYEQELTGKTRDQLEELNREIAENLTALYGTKVNDNFASVRTLTQSLAGYMESLYGEMPGQAETPDDRIGYMAGADPETLREEFSKVGGIRSYIATLAEYDVNDQNVLDIYVVTESGMCLDGTGKAYPGEYPELRTAEWYVGAKESGKPFWAKVFTGAATGIRKITCGVPFYDETGTFRGVAATDLAIDHIYETALSVRSDQVEHALLLDDGGAVMINPDAYDLGEVNPEEGIFIKDGGFLSFVEIPETSWTLCLVFRFELVQKTTADIARIIETNSNAVSQMMNQTLIRTIGLFLLLIVAGCGLVLLLSRKMAEGLTAPINRLIREVGIIGEGKLDYRIRDMDTGDEIGLLADSFNDMTGKLKSYVENLAAVTAEKERIGAELSVATEIQASMLPCIFPAFPERPEIDIFATMEPAKEVGGDFYDFFLIDEYRLGIVMADVSGKGVPAALFMVIAKTLIKNHAQAGEDPSEVFTKVNQQLCENNAGGLFVTAWMGIYNMKSGTFTYVNAGHNPPLIRRSDGAFEYLRGRAGFVLAGMEGMQYKEAEMQLYQGDMVYLYTDGVTEATDTENQLYGEERLLEVLNSKRDEELTAILRGIRTDIDRFVKGAPQFDDITMLVLKVRERSRKEIRVPAVTERLPEVLAFVDGELEELDCSMKTQMQIDIAVEEIFANIAHYAYGDETGEAVIQCMSDSRSHQVIIRFLDQGSPYDPLSKTDPDISLSAEEREIGGLGIYMVKQSMDEVNYEYRDGQNILTIKKQL